MKRWNDKKLIWIAACIRPLDWALFVSIGLCAATAAAWVQSYHYGYRWERETHAESDTVAIASGEIKLAQISYTGTIRSDGSIRTGSWQHWRDRPPKPIPTPAVLSARARAHPGGSGRGYYAIGWGYGFWTVTYSTGTVSSHAIIMPVWSVTALATLVSVFIVMKRLRKRSAPTGSCGNGS